MGNVAKEPLVNGQLRAAADREGAPTNQGRVGLWLAGITALAAVLRIVGLNSGLWWDEIYFVVVSVRRPLLQIITTFPSENQHPLYAVLAWLSIHGFGEHVWSLRLPALIFGVATIPMLYLVGTSVASRGEALLAAAFLTVSYHHVWFSQNARGYSALAFWALASTYFFLRGIRTGRRGPWIAYALATALGIYTHLTMAFLLTSHVLICAATMFPDWRKGFSMARWRLPILGLLLAVGFTLLFYAPVLSQVRDVFLHRSSSMKAVSTPAWALWETVRVLLLGLGGKLFILLGAGLLVGCGAWSYFRQSRFVFALFALPAAITAIGAFLGRGTMYPRFGFFLIGFAVLILVRGVVVLPRLVPFSKLAGSQKRAQSVLTATLATVLLMASAFSLMANYRYPKQDYQGAIRFVETAGKNEVVLTAGAAIYPLRQYYAEPWDSVETPDKLRTICNRDQPVWVVYTMPRYLEAAAPGVMEMIRKEFTVIRVFHGTLGDGDVYVAQYNRPA